MRTYEIKWTISGKSKINASSEENAIKRIEIMDTQALISPEITPDQTFDIKEIGELISG